MSRRTERPGPDAIRTARLLRYLIEGNSVEVDGRVFFYEILGDDVNQTWIAVNKFNADDMFSLASNLEGVEFQRVMNFKSKVKYGRKEKP